MKLADTTRLLAGGVGSGCHGENCGRPHTSVVVHDPGKDRDVAEPLKRDVTLRLMERGHEVGYADLRYDGPTVRVVQTFINPEHRGKGLGKELYRRVIEHAKERGAQTLRSDHGVALSEDARRVWESMRRAEPDRIRKRSKGYVYQIQ